MHETIEYSLSTVTTKESHFGVTLVDLHRVFRPAIQIVANRLSSATLRAFQSVHEANTAFGNGFFEETALGLP